jgi:choline dehydrogenase-like flavoprotein
MMRNAGASAKFDVIIAGASSAGCLLADRFSENERRSVLLVQTMAETLAAGRLIWLTPIHW